MTESLLRVRPARADDAPPIFALCNRLWDGEPDYILDVWDAWLAEGNLFTATLADSDEPVALLRLRMLSPREAWFGGLRVHPDLHGRGAGRQLIGFAQTWARERGARSLGYMTETGNSTMHHLAQRLGFQPIGTAIWHRWPPAEPMALQPAEPVRAQQIGLERSPNLAAQNGLYTPDWAFQQLTAERLAAHAAQDELFSSPDGSAWAIFVGAEDIFDWPLLAHAEGEREPLRQLLAALRATSAARAQDLTALLFAGSPLLAICQELGFAPTEERYSFFIKPLESDAGA